MNIKLKIYHLIGLFIMISCSGQESRQEEIMTIGVKPEKQSVSGALSKHIEVLSEEYEFEHDAQSSLVIRVRAKAKMEAKQLKNKIPKLFASLLSEKGIPVTGTGRMEIDYQSREVLKALLLNGEGEDIIYLSSYGSISEEQLGRIKSFEVTSSMEEYEETSAGERSEVEESIIEKDPGTNANKTISKALDELEKEVKAFSQWVKKNPNSDVLDATEKYNKVLIKIHNLTSKMDGHQDDMTTEQLEKLLKIQTELAKTQQSYMDNYYSN